MGSRDWLLVTKEQEEKEEAEARATRIAKLVAKWGPICEVCGWPINHPTVQYVDHPGKTHDCYTGDPMAR
jgi:hypothetical protein